MAMEKLNASAVSVSRTVAISKACGDVWPCLIWKSLSQRKRIPNVPMPTTELAKKNRTKRRKRT